MSQIATTAEYPGVDQDVLEEIDEVRAASRVSHHCTVHGKFHTLGRVAVAAGAAENADTVSSKGLEDQKASMQDHGLLNGTQAHQLFCQVLDKRHSPAATLSKAPGQTQAPRLAKRAPV
jgi:hypothetical protein